jgi:maltooligosyltrehalose synthase
MTIVPRLVIRAGGHSAGAEAPALRWQGSLWQGTRICVPQGSWTNVLSGQPYDGGEIELSELWRDFPVALLERTGSRGQDEHR